MRLTRTSDLWWKNAVVYCLDVETYQDGNGDGIGDFAGLTQRIDHLERLGVTCVWLMPFYPTRERDDGYDITDFYGVDPRLGTLGDFTEFVRTAKDRGIRVIADLVVNHTSEDHPWFQDARSGRDSAHRDWYVWADEPPKDGPQGVVFPDAEDSLWEYDKGSAQYYLHRFYKQQPDLNVANPEVRDEIARVMGFWTQLGLSGFRVDAVPFLLETAGQADAGALPDPHEYLADLRAFLGRRNGEAVLLGEVNLPYDDTARFFGDPSSDRGDELTMCFDFIAMQQMYLSMAREDAGPLAGALRDRPAAPRDAHWATFVRNHDELTLDKLSDTERAEVFASFGPDKNMQLYDRGCAAGCHPWSRATGAASNSPTACCSPCRAPPCSSTARSSAWGEPGRRGTPGRTDAHAVDLGGGRLSFSTADPDAFPNPLAEGAFGPQKVNVYEQSRDPGSLLSRMRLFIERYREAPELAWGDYRLVDTTERAVLAHIARTTDGTDGAVLAMHNFAGGPVTVRLRLPEVSPGGRLMDLLDEGHAGLTVDDDGLLRVELPAYGYRWLRVGTPADDPVRVASD